MTRSSTIGVDASSVSSRGRGDASSASSSGGAFVSPAATSTPDSATSPALSAAGDPDAPIKVGIGQIAPVFLDRAATLARVVELIREASANGCRLVTFGEALVPGYPMWLGRTGGAAWDDPRQKAIHARYIREAVTIEDGHLEPVQAACRETGVWVVLGVIERPRDRGQSLYCSCVTIDGAGQVASVHRKLMPTYEERLVWGVGDGAGLVVHGLDSFTLGSLNCWENWMPLPRASLQAQGETLHVAIWPGCVHNTADITRFIAREGRSYVISASSLLRATDLPSDVPHRDAIVRDAGELIHNGGSAIAGPDGEWVVEPVAEQEGLITAVIDPVRVREERQNFDPSGHYARPEILQLRVTRERHQAVVFEDR
ncbi:MAG: carbon-nitrogen hydrolase family protein [Phycisphaerales bacterium]